MLIVKIESDDNGLHLIQSQSHRKECWLEGYVEVPKELESKVIASEGYCVLSIYNGKLFDIKPTDKPEMPTPKIEEEITALDILNALTGGVD